MCPKTLTAYQSLSLLDQWYEAMRLNQFEQSAAIKETITARLDHYRSDQSLMLHYTLLEYRFYILNRDHQAAEDSIKKVQPFKEELSNQLLYYYHFFQGLYCWQTGQYQEALDRYTEARETLDELPGKLESAEYFYRLATVYYDLRKSLLSIHYVNQAKQIFKEEPLYQCRWADCENLLGVNCITLKQYEEAEEHLLYGLDLAKESGDLEISFHIKYNLGFLYAEQNLSVIAIRYLKDIYDHRFNLSKTLFMLSREYLKTGKFTEGNKLISEGLELCETQGNKEYWHHLKLIQALFSKDSIETIEPVVNEGLEFFKKEELWFFVKEYSDHLGKLFFENEKHEKASHYYYLGHVAKEKLFFREALK